MECITTYENVEKAIRKCFKEEETDMDKSFFLKQINRVIAELYRDLD